MAKGGNVIEVTDFGPKEARQPHHGPIQYEERDAKAGKALRARRVTSLEILERNGTITPSMRAAGDRFFLHFSQAGLCGRYATINLFRVAGGGGFSEAQHHHLIEVRQALDAVGKGLGASILWDVAGIGHTVKDWALSRVRPVRPAVALGILIGALDRLCDHWKL